MFYVYFQLPMWVQTLALFECCQPIRRMSGVGGKADLSRASRAAVDPVTRRARAR